MESYVESLARKLAVRWQEQLQLSDIDFVKLQYGLEIIFINVSKILVILFISLFTGTFVDTLLISIMYGLLRTNMFGEHAKSSIMCTVVSCITHVGIPLLLSNFVLNTNLYLIICMPISVLVYFYAPADTEKHPILGERRREKLRNGAITSLIFIITASIFIPYERIQLMSLLSQLYAVIGILPITYKILRRKRNNYEDYE